MNLLDATAHLIDLAKTFGREDKLTLQAIRRMEKRLDVLQLRKAKNLRARRHKAWWNGPSTTQCPHPECNHVITFGDFVKSAVIDGRGRTKEWFCPHCGRLIFGDPASLVHDPADVEKDTPCHSLPKDQWCDHDGPGGFMGHTCN